MSHTLSATASVSTSLTIVEVSPPNDLASGDYCYRAAGPCAALLALPGADRVVCITSLHPRRDELMARADVVLLNNLCDPDLLPALHDRRERGQATVYDLHDDVTAFQQANPLHYFFSLPENQRLVFKTVSLCSALQANNQALLERFGSLCKRTALFPNQLAQVPPLRPHDQRAPLTVGWAGSAGHLEDVAAIAPALCRWIRETPGVRLATMGSARIAALFADLPQDRRRHTPGGSLADYYRFVGTLDVGVAPLGDVPYNRSRSDVKFLEYAAFGAAPVVQRLRPYLDTVRPGETGLLFGTPDELVASLQALHGDRALLARIRAAAHAYALGHRLEAAHAPRRLDLYGSLGRPPGTSPAGPPLGPEFPSQVPARVTPFEELMYRALVLLETRDDPQGAETALTQAAALEPRSYLPHLLLAKVAGSESEIKGDEREARELALALRKNPRSVRAHLMLGDLCQRQGRPQSALLHYEAAAQTFQRWEVPYLRFAASLESLGSHEEARQFRALAASVATWLSEQPPGSPRWPAH